MMPDNAAAIDPTPGDLWHEMYVGVCLVVARDGDYVCVCKDRQACDPDRYTFVNPQWMTVAEFRDWLSYDSIPGYWAQIWERGCNVSSYAAEIQAAVF